MDIQEPVTAKRDFQRIGLALLLFAVVDIGSQYLIKWLLVSLREHLGLDLIAPPWAQWVFSFAPIYFLAIPLTLLVLRSVPADRGISCKLGWKNFFLFLLMSFPLMYAGNLIGNLLSMLLSGGEAENHLAELTNSTSPLKYLVMVFLAPLLEEYVFRKQLIDRTARYGEKTAVLFSAFAFGIFHMNLFQFFYAFALGALFAYIYLRTRRLRYSVILHMLINFHGAVVAPYLLSMISIGEDMQTISTDSLGALLVLRLYSLLLIALCIAGLVILIVKARQFVFVPAPQELPREDRFKTVYCNIPIILFTLVCLAVFVIALFPAI